MNALTKNNRMKISIITINYNNSIGLEKTIKSVISQDFKDYEYIIIDGGSNDRSVDVIEKYADKIDFWISEPDKGIYNAMNKGVSHAHGEYINFLNSEDLYYDNNTLSNICKFLDADIIVGKCYIPEIETVFGYNPAQITMLNLFTDTFNHQATFIKTMLLKKNKYNESYKIVSDWIFLVEQLIFNNCTYQSIDDIIVRYDGNGVSSNTALRLKERETFLKSCLPNRIYSDYELFVDIKKSPVLNYIHELSKTNYKFQLYISKFIKFSLIIFNKIMFSRK